MPRKITAQLNITLNQEEMRGNHFSYGIDPIFSQKSAIPKNSRKARVFQKETNGVQEGSVSLYTVTNSGYISEPRLSQLIYIIPKRILKICRKLTSITEF